MIQLKRDNLLICKTLLDNYFPSLLNHIHDFTVNDTFLTMFVLMKYN